MALNGIKDQTTQHLEGIEQVKETQSIRFMYIINLGSGITYCFMLTSGHKY